MTTDPCCSVCREIGGPHGVPEPIDGDRRIVLEDEVDWHDVVQHPVWQEGCAACVARAEWIEANR